MRRLMVACVAGIVVSLGVALAGPGWSTTHSLAGGPVAVTNEQANTSWVPVAVLIQYAAASSGTVDVRRVSQGVSVVLGLSTFTNTASLVWVPEAAFSFGVGDVLVIRSSETNGILQLMRRGD